MEHSFFLTKTLNVFGIFGRVIEKLQWLRHFAFAAMFFLNSKPFLLAHRLISASLPALLAQTILEDVSMHLQRLL